MKRFFGFAFVIASLSRSSIRRQKITERDLYRCGEVGSTQLPAGDYKVSWTTNGFERTGHHCGKGKARLRFRRS